MKLFWPISVMVLSAIAMAPIYWQVVQFLIATIASLAMADWRIIEAIFGLIGAFGWVYGSHWLEDVSKGE